MRKREALFSNFNSNPYFTKRDLLILGSKFAIPGNTINSYIQRGIKNKEIYPIKRNFYILNTVFENNKANLNFRNYLANILLSPSYVSRESALQYYGLLSEAAINYTTSISIKTTRSFKNSLGMFEYKTISRNLFTGYASKSFTFKDDSKYSFVIAEPYKAIFDYLYYRTSVKEMKDGDIVMILDEYRINYQELPKIELKKLTKLIADYHEESISRKTEK